ncbi:MAG: CoA transferase [Chloroflexi bacterium]|nr:CoA transferase [Chloroflexota bacterium]
MDKHIEEWTRQRHDYQVMEVLQEAGVMAGPSLSTRQAFEDPHLKAREFFVEGSIPC